MAEARIACRNAVPSYVNYPSAFNVYQDYPFGERDVDATGTIIDSRNSEELSTTEGVTYHAPQLPDLPYTQDNSFIFRRLRRKTRGTGLLLLF